MIVCQPLQIFLLQVLLIWTRTELLNHLELKKDSSLELPSEIFDHNLNCKTLGDLYDDLQTPSSHENNRKFGAKDVYFKMF